MGSRRGRYAALIAVILVGCTSGAPPGFAGGRGDRWTVPLIGPLEDGLLLVPVTIDGKGPFVFAIATPHHTTPTLLGAGDTHHLC